MKSLVLLTLCSRLVQYAYAQPQHPLVSPPSHLPSLSSFGLSPADQRQFEDYIASFPEKRLVQLEENGPSLEITEGEKSLLTFQGRRFIDVTSRVETTMAVQDESYPAELAYNASFLEPAFERISIDHMRSFLTEFSSFRTRKYNTEDGRKSQLWLLAHLKSLAGTDYPGLTITEFTHGWPQKSIIVRFSPSAPDSSTKVVILSSHQDSTNQIPFLSAPGADDDGSGTTCLIQIFTSLLKGKYQPTLLPLELHFYSAEEGGLLGSGEVARAYRGEGKEVRAVMHMDVTAYIKPGTTPVVGIINDNVDQGLVVLLRKIITEYAQIPYADTKCGYGCSDHASWQQLGFPASCISEGKFEDSNPNMHSTRDTIDLPGFSFEHIEQFVRIGLAMAWELAGGGESA